MFVYQQDDKKNNFNFRRFYRKGLPCLIRKLEFGQILLSTPELLVHAFDCKIAGQVRVRNLTKQLHV